MPKINRLALAARRFAKDESGNFALMFAAASTVLMMSAGLAVDYTRMISARSQLRSALDSALLSTALDLGKGTITTAQAEVRAQDFFDANLSAAQFPAGSARIAGFAVNPTDNSVSANAETDLEMMFPVFGVGKHAKVVTHSAAGFSERKIEVSMVLDVTGSMEDFNKINDLKTAAKAGVSEFLANGAGNTRVAIVPYSFGVNAGSLKHVVANEDGSPATDSCASERRGAEAFTDAAPGVAKVTRANRINYWADDNNDGNYTIRPNGYVFDLPMDYKPHGGLYGADCPETPVQPLTKNAATLNKTIDDLSPTGGTAGQIGIQWGWYMISPEWKSVFSATSEPEAYGKPHVDKYLILMTDGVFNSEASGLTGGDVGNFTGINQLSGRLAMTYCEAIKARGVKLFTIGFRLNDIPVSGERTESMKLLADCASTATPDQQTFYNAENGAELTAAFREIAKRVEVVRLTN